MKRKLEELIKEYSLYPAWYYHMVLEKVERGELFNSTEQFAYGMNSVAIGQYVCGVRLVFFNLMSNHCHFLGYGTGESFCRMFAYLRERITRQLKRDGSLSLPRGYSFKLVRVEDERQLADTIVYIARNPYKALKNRVPSGYIWGTNYLVFSDISKLLEKTPVSGIGTREMRKLLVSRAVLPSNYMVSRKLGFVLPESYVMAGKAQEVLRTSWNYCWRLLKNMDAHLLIAEGLGEDMEISDDELNSIIYGILDKEYGIGNVTELDNDERCRLAVRLRKKYKLDPYRIGRRLNIPKNMVRSLFGLE